MRVLTATAGPLARGVTLRLGSVSPGVAAYRSDAFDDSAALASLLAELLLGARDIRWPSAVWTAGDAKLSTPGGELTLRRAGGASAPRLTLVPAGPRPAEAPVAGPSDWQAGLSPAVLGTVFFAPPASLDPLRPLLSVEVAETFNRLSAEPSESLIASSTSPRPAEELLQRRDDLAGRIEALLATRRQESARLDEELQKLDREWAELAEQVEELRRRVRGLEEQLESEGARVRYEELSRVAAEAEGRQAADQWAPRVEELDAEVSRWRTTLAELESREAYVRGELARVRPDDSAPQLLVADQRASIAVTQRLVADLESEVARFARSGDSPVCVCDDAHPRLNPLVDTLGRHVERLAALIGQQEDALRTQELMSEAAQLERSQSELRRQLDHLLERRQTLHRSSRARTVRGELIDRAYGETIDQEGVAREHAALREELRAMEAELRQLDQRRQDAVERRRRLLHADQLADWQRELDSVQSELARSVDPPSRRVAGSLRASDVLARLTDGEFTQLRLAPGGRSIEARDRGGRIVPQADLSIAEARLVAWALRLALADACHAAGVAFTLVLDQPFAELDDRHAANLATCLDDYARRGRQVILLAREGAGLARLRGLGVAVHGLADEVPVAPAPTPRKTVREETVTRPWLLDVDDPIERFPAPIAAGDDAFARARVRTVGDLITGDPSAIAEEMAVSGVTAELVALWQAHSALVCFTPHLELAEAKLLVDCDVLSVEQLAGADSERLAIALRKQGVSEATLARVSDWIEGAAENVERWESTGYAKTWRRNRRERRDRIRENSSRRAGGGPRAEASTRDGEPRRRRRRREAHGDARSPDAPSLKFYLEVTSDIEAAPSIGPKRAAQLSELGVSAVLHLLEADPEDLATRLGDSRVDAAKIVAWQHQAGLMCRIPGLRGHDAQVLVGSGFASAEEIASMKPAELLEFVDPFCDTPEGQRALRGSARPDLTEVTQWVQGARQRRPVGAA